MSQTAISDEYRARQRLLTKRATARLSKVFPSLNFRDLDATAPGWILAAERVGTDLRSASVNLAATTYSAWRADAGIAGVFEVASVSSGAAALRESLLIDGPYAAKHLLSGGARIPDVARVTFAKTTGRVLQFGQDGGRELIASTSLADRRAIGFTRITRPGACPFCLALADRGAVYSEKTAHFASHPNCTCTAVPVFRGGERGPEADVMQYVASTKNRTQADRDRLRGWIEQYKP